MCEFEISFPPPPHQKPGIYSFITGSGTGRLPLASCQGLQLPPGPATSPSAFLTFRVPAWE